MSLELEKNKDQNKLLLSELNQRIAAIKLGGGKTRLEKIRKQGKMTARERVSFLLDDPTVAIEIGAMAGYEMYAKEGGCPAGGVIVMMGYVSKKLCVVVANDASVKAGAWFPITAKKTSEHRKLRWKIKFQSYTSLTVRVFFFPCKMRFFLTKNILEESLEIMLR